MFHTERTQTVKQGFSKNDVRWVRKGKYQRGHPYPPPNQGEISSRDGHAIIHMHMFHDLQVVSKYLGLKQRRTRRGHQDYHMVDYVLPKTGQNEDMLRNEHNLH